jgi:hypothetical protein
MAQVAGTTDTLDIVGIAEDIEDAIFLISPTDTPVLTGANKKRATNILHQWQTDSLAAVTHQPQVEGDDASFLVASPTVMLSNVCQINRKTLIVSRTADTVRKYGRAKETVRLIKKYGKEIKRDIEYSILGYQGSSVVSASTARASAGLGAMIVNRRFASGTGTNTAGTVPGYASAGTWTLPTSGTNSTFVEADLKAALELAWTDGGNPTKLYMNSGPKKSIAGFAGATAYAGFYNPNQSKAQGAVIAGVDTYISDYGSHTVILDRFMTQSVVYCIDPEFISVAWLDRIQMVELAKTGDADKSMLIGEWTLVLENPDAHAQVRDITPNT